MKSRVPTSERFKEIAQPRAKKWGTRRDSVTTIQILDFCRFPSPFPTREPLKTVDETKIHFLFIHGPCPERRRKKIRKKLDIPANFVGQTGENLESARLSLRRDSRLHPDIWYSQHTLVLYRARSHGRETIELAYKRVFLCSGEARDCEALAVCFIGCSVAKRACCVPESLHRYVVNIDNANATWLR